MVLGKLYNFASESITKKQRTMRKVFLVALLAASSVNVEAQLVLNEIMQSNIDCVMDDINEFPDSWVELYNAGTTATNLSHYSIADTDNPDEAWQLPDKTIVPGGYLLVY